MRRLVPAYPLSDYVPPELAELGIYIGRLEDSLVRRPTRGMVHRHEHFELFWVQGTGMHLNDFDRFPLRGSSLIVVSPGQVHSWPDSAGLTGTMIGFTAAFFDGSEPPPSLLLGLPFVYRTGVGPVIPVDGDTAVIDDTFARLATEFEYRNERWSEMIRALLRIAFVLALRVQATRAPGATSARIELVQRFRLALEQHFLTTTSVSAFARLLKVTPGYLNDTVREQIGRPAGDLIRERVLLESRRLLLHSGLSISEIAYHLGFDDPSYFARFFRREVRQSPGEYRTAIREKYRTMPR